MQRIRLDSKDGLAAGWIGMGGAHMPDRVRHNAPQTSGEGRDRASDDLAPAKRSWLRAGMRIARNAAIGLALLTAVPFAVIGLVGGRSLNFDSSGARARLESVERLRQLMAPADPSITPTEAGVAFRALQATRGDDAFPMHQSAQVHWRPWKTLPLNATMFAQVRNPASSNSLWTQQILYAATMTLSQQERDYLRTVAEAPIWKDFDRVAAAREVDIIGGQFVLPFSRAAFAPALPTLRYAETRDLANAAVIRAAHYVALWQLGDAEVALKSVVSFGFALVDNANSGIEAALGRTIAETGRDGLLQLYTIQNNEPLLAGVRPAKEFAMRDAALARRKVSGDVLRARMLKDANDPSVPRAWRFEALRTLSFASCGNVREVVFGPGKDVQDAFANAKQSLARYPSEDAYLDLLYRVTERIPEDAGVSLGPERFIVGAATIAGVVLNNPRVAACTRMAMLSY